MATTPIKSYADHFLPEFSRRQWASGGARSIWEPRITSIGQHFAAAERQSVETGIRSAAIQSVAPEQLPELARRAAERGLVATPISTQGRPESYAASSVAKSVAGPWDYRVALTTFGAAAVFSEAWRKGDDDIVGELLGYPECCRRFFVETWAAGSVDPTWEMADHHEDSPLLQNPRSAPGTNILLRWLGVRLVPHLPCGFRCKETVALGLVFRELMPEPERGWMDELLSMPMLWSSLNGIGECITPIVTTNFRSDVSFELREIERTGTRYPEAGAHGLRFPYRPPPARRVDERLWKDNGFSTLEAMDRAHRVIMSVLPDTPRSVLDLGCGNGLLARKLVGVFGKAMGVECDEGRAERAKKNLDSVICGDLFDVAVVGEALDLAVLMPGRLLENPGGGLVSKLRTCDRLLVYAYGDWLERYGSLEELCRAAGLEGGMTEQALGDDVAAGIWEWR